MTYSTKSELRQNQNRRQIGAQLAGRHGSKRRWHAGSGVGSVPVDQSELLTEVRSGSVTGQRKAVATVGLKVKGIHSQECKIPSPPPPLCPRQALMLPVSAKAGVCKTTPKDA